MNESRYTGLAELKTEGTHVFFGEPPTPRAEAELMARQAAYSMGRSYAIERKRRSVPEGWKQWSINWLRGFDDFKRRPGFYWIDDEGKWRPAEWTGAHWLLLGDDVERATVDAIGRHIRVPRR